MLNYAGMMRSVSNYRNPWKTVGTDLQYMQLGDMLYLQPTSSDYDWKKNFQFRQVPFGEGKNKIWVHRGFKDVYEEGRETLLAILESGHIQTVCGFSHGAAIAILLYKEFFDRTGIKIQTVLYGCPRVVNIFSYLRNKKVFDNIINIQTSTDLVCSAPPVVFFYMHVGVVIRLETGYVFPRPSHHRPEVYLEYINILLT